jgi:two-component system nitrate/nitrite sensor histidine kinase NarX
MTAQNKKRKVFVAPRSSIGTRLTFSIGLIITVTSLFLFVGIYKREEKQRIQQINTQAQALLTEMIVSREWVSSYGGVWTTSPGDFYLTEKNGYYQKAPAMVTKELSNLSDDKGYYRFHITSLVLTNPENTPDTFEYHALQEFEKKPEPITSIDRSGDEPVYRLMIPLKIEESCLECHAEQGYREGDIRGGLSVLIPVSEMDESLAKSRRILVFSALSSVGLVMIALYILVRRTVISPVAELKKVAIAVSKGDYDARCQLETGDELEVFAETLNQMATNLKLSQSSLQGKILQRTQELDTISEVALIISQAGALEDVLKEALQKVLLAAGARGGLIQLFEEQNTRVATHRGLPTKIVRCFNRAQKIEDLPREIFPAQEHILVRDIETGICEKLFANNRCPESEESCLAMTKEFSRFASVLLQSRRRPLGAIILFSDKENSFSPEVMQLMACIGNQLGVAIENARFYQRVEQLAVLEERTRISRELHDSLAQTLGWLSIKTEILDEDLKQGKIEKSHAEMTAIRRVVRDACYDVRESIDGLRTRPTGDLSLTAATWIAEFRQRSGLMTDFHAMDEKVPLSPAVETELLRILQEALTNVRKHAKAKQVRIDLQIKGNFAELVIEDDGSGFDYRVEQESSHFGLRIMRERAESLGGTFDLLSEQGQGTRVMVSLPLYPTK